jgi:hypothetical protein
VGIRFQIVFRVPFCKKPESAHNGNPRHEVKMKHSLFQRCMKNGQLLKILFRQLGLLWVCVGAVALLVVSSVSLVCKKQEIVGFIVVTYGGCIGVHFLRDLVQQHPCP